MDKFLRLKKALDFSLKKYLGKYSICMFCTLIYTIAALAYPSILSLIIDQGVAQSNIENIFKFTFLFLIIGIVMNISYYFQKVSFTKLSQNIVIDVQNKLLKMLTTVEYNFWTEHKVGDVLTVIQHDVGKLESLLTTMVSDFFVNLFVAVGVGSYLIYIDFTIGIVLIALTLIFVGVQRFFGIRAKKHMVELRNQQGDVISYTNEIVNHLPVIQMIGLSRISEEKFCSLNYTYKKKIINQTKLITNVQNVSMLFSTLGIFSVLLIGSIKVFNGDMTVGLLFSLTMYVQRLYNPIISLSNTYISIKNIIPILEKILGIFETSDYIKRGDINAGDIHGELIIKNLKFRYRDGKNYVFNNYNMKINAGNIIGIVGENGTGKTTLLRLMSRLCSPLEGKIILDGKELDKYDYEFLWKQIGIMPQETYIPRGKIKDALNIINQKQYELAKQLLNDLHFSLKRFPLGLETEIGENAIALSGGERQKLSFIRLLLQEKNMYILDEPTAALDLESEDVILRLIKEHMSQKTCIIITHRPKLLEVCNSIIKM